MDRTRPVGQSLRSSLDKGKASNGRVGAEAPLPSRTSSASMTWFRFNGFFSVPVSRNTPARRGDTITLHPKAQEASGTDGFPLSYGGPLLIVGGGAVEIALLREIAAKVAGLVGADSGADRIIEAGLVPDAVIGDLDSVADLAALPQATRVAEIADQNSTDFEKALSATQAP